MVARSASPPLQIDFGRTFLKIIRNVLAWVPPQANLVVLAEGETLKITERKTELRSFLIFKRFLFCFSCLCFILVVALRGPLATLRRCRTLRELSGTLRGPLATLRGPFGTLRGLFVTLREPFTTAARACV